KEVAEKVWPKTKKELEKAIDRAKVLMGRGEEYLKGVTEKGVENTKKLSLSLKREKLYHDLGKLAAVTPKNKWAHTKRINDLLKDIKTIDREVKKK
ncbi:MAG: hypothetical protein JSW40_04505, partial [Candidatus Omnitrophota bacterium]